MWPFQSDTVIAESSNFSDIINVTNSDQYGQFQEGDTGKLVLHYSRPIGDIPGVAGTIDTLGSTLVSMGAFHLATVEASGSDVIITYQIAEWPVWLVVFTVLSALTVLFFISWTLYRVTEGTADLGTMLLAGGIVWLLWTVLSRKPQGTYGDLALRKVSGL